MASHSGCCASSNERDGHNHGQSHGAEFSLKREIIPVAVSMFLFVVGLVFYELLHITVT